MKTEADKLRNSIQYGLGVMDSGSGEFKELSNKIDELFELSYLEGQSSPKIKQLEWDETFSHYFVESPVGTYTILRVHNFEEKELWRLYFNGLIMVNDIDPDEAKAAAQADFEKRVMECLDM